MMSTLLKLARRPPLSVPADARVLDACLAMIEHHVGAVLVIEDGRARGIFTERDILLKMIPTGRDPKTTPVSAVMTTPVFTIRADASRTRALRQMLKRHIRHLPLVDDADKVLGILSMRHLMRDKIDILESEVEALSNYAGSDGIGG
jgi:CBS domain-containing protein